MISINFIFILVLFLTIFRSLEASKQSKHHALLMDFNPFVNGFNKTKKSRYIRSTNIARKQAFGALEHGRCECGLFGIQTDPKKPVLSKESIEVPCDKEGQDTCEKLCIEIAKIAQNQGPIIVCDAITNTNNLLLRLFSRVCKAEDWSYAGVESNEELCCKDKLPVKCNGHLRVPTSLTGEIMRNVKISQMDDLPISSASPEDSELPFLSGE